MNESERRAWRVLLTLGASKLTVDGKHALCLETIRINSGKEMAVYLRALAEVAGVSEMNHWLPARGASMIVTDDLRDPGTEILPI